MSGSDGEFKNYFCKSLASLDNGDGDGLEVSSDVYDFEPGATIFTSCLQPFPIIDSDVLKTGEFILACKGVITFAEMFGKLFIGVRYDLQRNTSRVERKYTEDTEKYQHLESMILEEIGNAEKSLTLALQWIWRTLHFMLRFMQLVLCETDDTPLSVHLKAAYAEVLEPFHGWMGMQLFNILSQFAPTRSTFFEMLAFNRRGWQTAVENDMQDYCCRLQKCVDHLTCFYAQHQLELKLKAGDHCKTRKTRIDEGV